jgi:hypothetical protein
MQINEANPSNPDGSIIYRSGMNLKIHRPRVLLAP